MEKVQLSFNCRTAGERIIERSTLVNIRTDSVDEAVGLYNELMIKLGKGAVISEHEYLPQIANNQNRMPVKTIQPKAQEPCLGNCPHCSTPLRKSICKKPGSRYYGRPLVFCPKFRVTGCSFIKELQS